MKKFEEAAGIRDQIQALMGLIKGRLGLKKMDELKELKDVLHLKSVPKKIEAFDVSNIGGHEAVGSLVSFYNGRFYKDGYKRFRIKDVSGIDDYAMIKEVVKRRYSWATEGKETLPDLIIIDGGKGHMNCARETLEELKLEKISVMGIAKEREKIYSSRMKKSLMLPPDSKALHLIQRIRDEAHRFAIRYHRSLRRKKTTQSFLDDIESIGEKRRIILIKHFGSLDRISKTSVEDLSLIKGISEHLARNIVKHFKNEKRNL